MKKPWIVFMLFIFLLSACADARTIPVCKTPICSPSTSAAKPTQTLAPTPIATTPPDETVSTSLAAEPTQTTEPSAIPENSEKPRQTAVSTSTIKPVEREIRPTAEPATEAQIPFLDKGNNAGFTEIDIDSTDDYRDFAAEFEYADNWGETELYRLTEKGYVKLGTIPGYITGTVGYQKPTITVNGSGVIYAVESSKLVSWTTVAKTYVIKNGKLALQSPSDSTYILRRVPVFTVIKSLTVHDCERDMDVMLTPGDRMTFEVSDESSMLFGPYQTADTNGYAVLYMEDGDCIKDGPFFGDCFYSDEVEWIS